MTHDDREWIEASKRGPASRLVRWGAKAWRHTGPSRLARLAALRLGIGLVQLHRVAWVHGLRW